VTRRLGTVASAATGLFFALASDARASEPVLPGEPRMMREPGEIVDVPDAADGSDPIDIDVGLTFRLDYERGAIERVRDATTERVAEISALSSRLVPEIKVGLFHDLAAIVRLPIILSATRAIEAEQGVTTVTSAAGPLFTLPFRSPERSGIESFTVGLAWGITNQARRAGLPSITLGAEVDIAVGDAMRACVDPPPEGQVRCADAADENRNGKRDRGELDAKSETDTGTARGTVAVALSLSVSRRIRYVEPFGTLRAKIEVPLADSPFKTTSLGEGETFPPVRAEAELGLGVVPWENRERFSRVWIDARITGGFATRGPDYSPLFDAIGASDASALRGPTETPAGRAYATGMTVSEAHGTLGARGSFVWRASELIELGLAAAIRHDLAHAIVADAKCVDGGDDCAAADNPAYRVALDGPEGAFTLAESLDVQFGASGAVMF
jgi:hypothetical protein